MRIRSLLIALSLTASPLACPAQTAEPAYAWRGCMIDVARHFFPQSFVERQIDVLAAHGINRLHFHLTDNGGWRVEMPQYPRLTSLAAWRTESDWDKWWVGEDRRYLEQGTQGAYGGFYTQAELRGLVDYAKKRGIEIVPEIEMPGHSEEVLAAYPELGCLGATHNTGDICPANPKAYEFFENVLTEIINIFPSEYIHIGGDEAGQSAWKTCERCQKLLAELGADDVDALQAHFVRKMAQFVASKGRKAMGWDEIIYPDMPAGTAITVWRNAAHAKRAIAAGLDVVMCPTSHAYLDYYQDVPDKEPRAIGGYVPLAKTYALNPVEGLTADEARHVLGVQGNLWTEYIPTEQQAEYMLYPRIFAIAEIGLKGEARPPYAQFRKRMIREVGALRKSGVNAFDLKHESGPRKESRKPVHHKASGCRVDYKRPFSPYYKAAGTATLTDGLRGGYQHGDGRWQGFVSGRCLDVVVDLGKRQSVRRVAMDFLQNSNAWIYFPKRLRFSVSADGEHFTPIFEKFTPRTPQKGTQFATYAYEGRRLKNVRFVRIEGEATAAGEWIFTDEIIVK